MNSEMISKEKQIMSTTKCFAYFINHYLAAAGTTTFSLRVIPVNITNIL